MGRIISNAIRKLDKLQGIRAGVVSNWDSYQFRISPTCPPSTSITFRGGYVWKPPASVGSYGWHIPSYTVDLADGDKTGRSTVSFTTPYAYVEYTILLRVADGLAPHEEWPETAPDLSIRLLGSSGEHATAKDAEDAMIAREKSAGQYYGIPVVGIIFRNNGNIVEYNQFMPIDKINRGRSYLFYNCATGWFTV